MRKIRSVSALIALGVALTGCAASVTKAPNATPVRVGPDNIKVIAAWQGVF